jgi:hypothetical protein
MPRKRNKLSAPPSLPQQADQTGVGRFVVAPGMQRRPTPASNGSCCLRSIGLSLGYRHPALRWRKCLAICGFEIHNTFRRECLYGTYIVVPSQLVDDYHALIEGKRVHLIPSFLPMKPATSIEPLLRLRFRSEYRDMAHTVIVPIRDICCKGPSSPSRDIQGLRQVCYLHRVTRRTWSGRNSAPRTQRRCVRGCFQVGTRRTGG